MLLGNRNHVYFSTNLYEFYYLIVFVDNWSSRAWSIFDIKTLKIFSLACVFVLVNKKIFASIHTWRVLTKVNLPKNWKLTFLTPYSITRAHLPKQRETQNTKAIYWKDNGFLAPNIFSYKISCKIIGTIRFKFTKTTRLKTNLINYNFYYL